MYFDLEPEGRFDGGEGYVCFGEGGVKGRDVEDGEYYETAEGDVSNFQYLILHGFG